MFFVPFSGFFTWKCINRNYLIAVYTLNTGTPCCFFLIRIKIVILKFNGILSSLKDQSHLSSVLEVCSYVRRYLSCCLVPCKSVISTVLCSLCCDCISGTYGCCIYTSKNVFCSFLLAFCWSFLPSYFQVLNSKYIQCPLPVCWQRPKT